MILQKPNITQKKKARGEGDMRKGVDVERRANSNIYLAQFITLIVHFKLSTASLASLNC